MSTSQPTISRFFKVRKNAAVESKDVALPLVEGIRREEKLEVALEENRKRDADADAKSDVKVGALDKEPATGEPAETAAAVAKRRLKFEYNRVANTKHNAVVLTEEQIARRHEYKSRLSQALKRNEQGRTADDGSDVEASSEAPSKRQKTSKSKLTPLDQQVRELKLQHMDKILAIQVGYKYKFYCQDAVKVHKILNIMLVPGKLNLDDKTPNDLLYNKLAYCSIPENRLHIHLQRLLDNGMKVGVVDQIETSAVKANGDNKAGLFKRRLTNVFTRATYIEFSDKNHDDVIKSERTLDSIMAIYETPDQITLVSVQPLTGEISYDQFPDDFMRNELETRLLHLEPIELLYIENSLTQATEKCLENFKKLHSNIRTIILPESKKSFYEGFLNGYLESDEEMFEFVCQFDSKFHICCSLLIEYLKEFQLDSSFKVISNYSNFNNQNHMLLNANTLKNLEIFNNTYNDEQSGSLIWLLDHTRTKFGYRLLRSWISKPLIDREQIEKRLDAIENIQLNFNHFLENFAKLLKSCPDLVKILSRLHYGKIGRKECFIFLNKLEEFTKLIIKFGKYDILKAFKSSLLQELIKELIDLLLESDLSSFMNMINSQHAMDTHSDDHVLKYFNLSNLSFDQEEITKQDFEISQINKQFEVELQEIRKFLRRPSVDYITSNKEPYLIEIRNTVLKGIPKDWVKISSTKLLSRFRTPQVVRLYKSLQYHNELYLEACNSVFKRFISKLDEHYTQINKITTILAHMDCLLSLSATSANANYVRPKFVDANMIKVDKGRNPIIEQLSNYVPNSTSMDKDQQCLIITGPNMGGKSSYVKQIGLIAIMSQVGCFVPCDSITMGIFNSIETRMGAFDDLMRGESTFFTEMSQTLNVLQNVSSNSRSLIILDELGRGTGTVDGISLATSILEYILQNNTESLVLFITHFPSICKLSHKYSVVKNYHMGYIEEKAENGNWPKVTFLYNLVEGIAKNSYGLNVAKLAFIDDEIINEAYTLSRARQEQVEQKRSIKQSIQLLNFFQEFQKDENVLNSFERLLQDIEI